MSLKKISAIAILALSLGATFASVNIYAKEDKPKIVCKEDPIFGGFLCCDDTQCHHT